MAFYGAEHGVQLREDEWQKPTLETPGSCTSGGKTPTRLQPLDEYRIQVYLEDIERARARFFVAST